MALSDYGFVGNDIIPNTPIEKAITGYLLAINKVYRGVFQNDNSNLLNFLNSVGTRHFFINDSSYNYLLVGEYAMFYDSYYSQNNVFKRFCYLNETTGEFILFDKNNDNAKLLERNTILQDAVTQLIDSGFQTSILPFYYYSNDYLTAVEFESFYRVFAYPFFKDYFIQRLKYLSLLRVYTEYRDFYLYDEMIYERSGDESGENILDVYNNLQFGFYKGDVPNGYLLNVEVYRYTDGLSYYLKSVTKNIYIPKRIIDNYILNYNDSNFYNKYTIFQSTGGLFDNDGVMLNGTWERLDLSTIYSITYNNITEDCYKFNLSFNLESFIVQQLTRLNDLTLADVQRTTTYCTWKPYGGDTIEKASNSRLTTISDCFDFSDI